MSSEFKVVWFGMYRMVWFGTYRIHPGTWLNKPKEFYAVMDSHGVEWAYGTHEMCTRLRDTLNSIKGGPLV